MITDGEIFVRPVIELMQKIAVLPKKIIFLELWGFHTEKIVPKDHGGHESRLPKIL